MQPRNRLSLVTILSVMIGFSCASDVLAAKKPSTVKEVKSLPKYE